MDKILLTTILLGVVVPGAVAVCAPDCSKGSAEDKVPDPLDCHNYYICLGPGIASDAPVACPDGNSFDSTTGKCESGTTCTPSCTSNCQLSCSLSSANIIPDPLDCGVYKMCVIGGVVSTGTCPNDAPYFDGKQCVSSQDSCCVPFCAPYCYTGAIEVPDPTDCRSYYICVDGALSNETRRQCENNKVFDIDLGRCRANAACVNLCDGNGGDPVDGTTVLTDGCTTSFTCPSSGNFARCNTCSETYYSCSGPNEQGQVQECPGDHLFNPNSNFPFCIEADQCPYYPSH